MSTKNTRPSGFSAHSTSCQKVSKRPLGTWESQNPKKADVECARRLPGEDVREHVVDGCAELGAIELEYLRHRVDGGDSIGVPQEVARPVPRAGGELEHVATRGEAPQLRLELGNVREPPLRSLGIEGVARSPEPPVVVLRRASAVVAALLGEQALDRGLVHAGDSNASAHGVGVRPEGKFAPSVGPPSTPG